MAQYRFNVFGQLVVITGTPGNWAAFLLGTDGKRGGKRISSSPGSLSEDDLCGYLVRSVSRVGELDAALGDSLELKRCDT